MKIQEAITRADNLKPNAYSQDDKIVWLNNLDLSVKIEILDVHEGAEAYEDFTGYTAETPLDTELLVPAPYDEMYVLYLQAMIDSYNEEYDRYDASMARFQAKYQDFASFYNRTKMPKGVKNIKYLG